MAKEIVEKIVKLAFEKALKDTNSDKKNALANHISSQLDNKYKISDKSIVRLFDKYIYKNEINHDERRSTVNAICSYIGYKDYTDFTKNYNKKSNNTTISEGEKQKTTKVEITNHNEIKLLNKNTATIWVAGILIILVTAFIWNNAFQNKKQIAPNQITINNFNANKNYYYYTTPRGKIELTENPTQKNAKPLTYTVFNKYLIENKIDTTSQKFKIIKDQYFEKRWKEKPRQKETVQSKKEFATKRKPKIQEKNVFLDSKTLFVEVKSKGVTDVEIQKKLIQKFKNEYLIKNALDSDFKLNAKTEYVFTNSKLTKDRIICTLTLDYALTDKNNFVIFSESKQVKGTGFSQKTAKNNTINKLKL